jgi:hypothetical protein
MKQHHIIVYVQQIIMSFFTLKIYVDNNENEHFPLFLDLINFSEKD